ncbi:MAG: hypothetical protein A4E66_02278 [Syntrophus sp. PtaB.Bin001]|nr:MAG: hypothetical protein A4E66_02278 [Syntrophus sp. PtaB.Bin001]
MTVNERTQEQMRIFILTGGIEKGFNRFETTGLPRKQDFEKPEKLVNPSLLHNDVNQGVLPESQPQGKIGHQEFTEV